jgi:uncharacterized protein YcbK (DUF882 family)
MKHDQQVSANFKLSEFFIHQLDFMDIKLIKPKLFLVVQQIRNAAGVPITINSGFRSPEKNKLEGGALDSRHLYDRPGIAKEELGVEAVDLTSRLCPISKIYAIAEANGLVTGLGDGRKFGFVHVDIRPINPGQPRVTWTY